MKHIIFDLSGKKIGSYEGELDESSNTRSHLLCPPHAVHALLVEGMDEDCVTFTHVNDVTVPAFGVEGQPNYVPEHVVLSHNETILDPALVAAKVAAGKVTQGQVLYDAMNSDVLDHMAIVFGTTNTASAAAYKDTWQLMLDKPALFEGKLGLINTSDVVAYAQAKMDAVEVYAVYRMERIAQFQAAKAAL